MKAFRPAALWIFLAAAPFAVADPTIFLVRHAEKGTDPSGQNDPDLSPGGRARAELLARILRDARISVIFVTEFKRTQETAEPLAKALSVEPVILPAKDSGALIGRLRSITGNALVVGHGDTIPRILGGIVALKDPVTISESDFGQFFVVHLGSQPDLVSLHF